MVEQNMDIGVANVIIQCSLSNIFVPIIQSRWIELVKEIKPIVSVEIEDGLFNMGKWLLHLTNV